jgi:AmmeMemoRadiSam system protein A
MKTTNKSAQTFQQEVLTLAQQAINACVSNLDMPRAEFAHPRLEEKLGVFVTLKKNNSLRGCIGMIESEQPLWQNIQNMAKAAALEDPRFDPVHPNELEDIQVEVSVLTKPKLISNPKQIKAGKHGVIIELEGRKGVFLPQVATEYGYNREQLLNMLCLHKMGLEGACWRSPEAKIYIFEAEVFN